MAVGVDKGENIRKAIKLVNDAKSEGSSLVVLPECFNCPYGTSKLSYFSFVYFRLRIWQTLVYRPSEHNTTQRFDRSTEIPWTLSSICSILSDNIPL